jgi:hypothetical protein
MKKPSGQRLPRRSLGIIVQDGRNTRSEEMSVVPSNASQPCNLQQVPVTGVSHEAPAIGPQLDPNPPDLHAPGLVYVNPSTIKGAGAGAFAACDLPRWSVVLAMVPGPGTVVYLPGECPESHGWPLNDTEFIGPALDGLDAPVGSLLNEPPNGVMPNVVVVQNEDGTGLSFKTLRPIQAREELFIIYGLYFPRDWLVNKCHVTKCILYAEACKRECGNVFVFGIQPAPDDDDIQWVGFSDVKMFIDLDWRRQLIHSWNLNTSWMVQPNGMNYVAVLDLPSMTQIFWLGGIDQFNHVGTSRKPRVMQMYYDEGTHTSKAFLLPNPDSDLRRLMRSLRFSKPPKQRIVDTNTMYFVRDGILFLIAASDINAGDRIYVPGTPAHHACAIAKTHSMNPTEVDMPLGHFALGCPCVKCKDQVVAKTVKRKR